MTHLIFAAVLQTAVMALPENSYTEAYRQAETGKPLVVLIGADWCPGCVTMKNSVIPQVRRNGNLDKVAFAVVNADHDRELARELMNGGSIPQLVIYRKERGEWNREVIVGAKSVSEVERLIGNAVSANQTASSELDTRR